MSDDSEIFGTFKPGVGYPINVVARMMSVSIQWVKLNLITSGECSFKRRGKVYLFDGQWIIEWMNRDFDLPDDDPDSTPDPDQGE